MVSLTNIFPSFRWIDSGVHTNQPIQPIVIDEALATSMGSQNAMPVCHLWICDKALYLGRRDAHLPTLAYALKELSKQGYGAVLRSSGGACVPLDLGVLNMALLIPAMQSSIDSYFELASLILSKGLSIYGELEFHEVAGSYCAGKYDFSMKKKKLGGMAQRRIKHGYLLQLCINVEGSGLSRGVLMEKFYQLAGLEAMNHNKPLQKIDASTIGSLSDVCGQPIHIQDIKSQLFASLSTMCEAVIYPLSLTDEQIQAAHIHLLEQLHLFSYTATDMLQEKWALSRTYHI